MMSSYACPHMFLQKILIPEGYRQIIGDKVRGGM